MTRFELILVCGFSLAVIAAGIAAPLVVAAITID